jgi:NitT/TauT family transport system substrate-binding protein
VVSTSFLQKQPDVAKRYIAAWNKAVKFINENPTEARKHLLKNTFTPEAVVDTVPLVGFKPVSELSEKDIQDFQRFIDFAAETKVLPEKADVRKALHRP